MRRKQMQRRAIPRDFTLQEGLGQGGMTVILPAPDGQATEPGNMARTVGFAEGELHSEIAGQTLRVRTAVCLKQCNGVRPLPTNEGGDLQQTAFSTLVDVVAKHLHDHYLRHMLHGSPALVQAYLAPLGSEVIIRTERLQCVENEVEAFHPQFVGLASTLDHPISIYLTTN